MKKIQMLIIDPQVDFCSPDGALYVPGADDDMKRLATFIRTHGEKISQIRVTLDCHNVVDVAHPAFWVNSDGETPDPFTIITSQDIKNATWLPFLPHLKDRMLNYVSTLEQQGNFPLCIWPPHCLIGTVGNSIYPDLSDALLEWQVRKPWNVDYVSKGSNIFTEHYGAIAAEVPVPNDPSTQINTRLIQNLLEADTIIVAGEAGSHCVKTTLEQIALKFGDDSYLQKIVLLTDAISPVIHPDIDFPAIQESFIENMKSRGMRVSTTANFF